MLMFERVISAMDVAQTGYATFFSELLSDAEYRGPLDRRRTGCIK